MLNNIIDHRRNASSSWSGYIHQGKVGFLVALRELKKCLENDIFNYKDYKILYENAEDFDIIDCTGRVISRHQVKARKGGEERETYSELFCIQTRAMIDGKVLITQKGFQIHKFDEQTNILEIEVDESSRYIHTIINVPDFYLSETDYLCRHKRRKSYTPNDSKIKLYPYLETEEFCPLSIDVDDDKIRDYCVNEIKEILSVLNNPLKDVPNHFNQVYIKYIASILDNSIGSAHQESIFPAITFEVIYNILITEIPDDDIYQAKSNLIYIWEEYKLDFEGEIPHETLKVMDSIVNDLLCKEKLEFEKIVRNLAPHEQRCKKVTIILNDTVLKKILFYLFEELKEFDSTSITYRDKYNDSYRVSLIAINDKPAQIANVIKKIINNKNLLNKSFDNRYLINDSISEMAVNETVYDFPEDSSAINYRDEWNTGVTDSIFNVDMEFIDIKKAIENLKEE